MWNRTPDDIADKIIHDYKHRRDLTVREIAERHSVARETAIRIGRSSGFTRDTRPTIPEDVCAAVLADYLAEPHELIRVIAKRHGISPTKVQHIALQAGHQRNPRRDHTPVLAAYRDRHDTTTAAIAREFGYEPTFLTRLARRHGVDRASRSQVQQVAADTPG